jgi:transposase InsO family protein
VGRIYQQTFIDTYAKVVLVRFYDCKNALVAADLLNDRVIPWYEEQEVRLLRILTDRGTKYCGKREHHEYQLYLAIEDVDHSKTQAQSPQTNGICERSIALIQMNFIPWPFERRFTGALKNFRQTWTCGLRSITKSAPILANTALGRLRCRIFWKPSIWRMRRCWTGWL